MPTGEEQNSGESLLLRGRWPVTATDEPALDDAGLRLESGSPGRGTIRLR